jgi:hypothetical protein
MLIERSKSARARPVTAGAAMAQTTSEHASAAAVRGMPVVQSTGEIELQGHQIRLYGMEGVRGHPVRELRRYLGRREVVCEPIGGGNEHRCRVVQRRGPRDNERDAGFAQPRRTGSHGARRHPGATR